MTPRAHLLLQVDVGRAAETARALAALPGVGEAVVTSGPYEVIASVEAGPDLGQVLARARRAPGLAGLRVLHRAEAGGAAQAG